MTDKKHIVVVDDHPTNLLLILRTLEETYRISCVENGRECLAIMDADKPDLVLMDVRMPQMNGYECCRIIKDNFEFNHIPVIFLSAHTEIEDKLKGYEAGGDDYLTKPCDMQEMLAKINHNLQVMEEFKGKLKGANDFATLAMSNSGELGVVLQFMEASFHCDDLNSLAQLLLSTLQAYDLNASVQLRGSDETLNTSAGPVCAPLEISLMTQIVGGDKITQLGRRCLCTEKHISVLIKNLPENDEMLCGRLKDHIVSLLNGASARMENLNMAREKENQVINRIKQALENIEKTLSNIEELADNKHLKISNIVSTLTGNINEAFSQLALTEEQENHFNALLNQSSDDLFKFGEQDDGLKGQFETISNQLFDIISSKIK